jgi:hypothetical protein
MADEIKKDDQVMVRKKMRNGNLIRFGSVVAIDGSGADAKARVNFPIDHTSVVVPVSELEKTSTRFGNYARVQPSAVRRSFTNR